MTVIENYSPKVQYQGPINIGDTLPIPFAYINKEDISCTLNDTILLLYNQDYTVTDQNLFLKRAISEEDTITIHRQTPLDQQAEFLQNNRFDSAKLNEALDKICMQQQECAEELSRTLQIPISVENFNNSMPYPQANKAFKVNSEGTGFTYTTYDPDAAISITGQFKQEAENAKNEAIHQATNAANSASASANSANAASSSASSAASTLASAEAVINTEKTNAIDAVKSQQTTSINAVKSQETSSISSVKSEGTTQVDLAKAEVTKATTQANNAANSATAAANSASQAEATLNSATTTINTEKTNAINAIRAQQTTSVNAVSTQQTSSVNTVKSTGQSYINKCKAWASSPNIVENGLRSAKYYAEQAQGKSDVTYATLRASRAYEDKGALLTDEQGYAEVDKYNRSTFDKSKFTVVGSPTITDDGVASGFSTNDYVTLGSDIINKLVNATNFNFTFRFRTGNSLGGLAIGFNNNISGGPFSLWVNASQVAPIVFLNAGGTATLEAIGNINKSIYTNTEYEAFFRKEGNNYGFGIRTLTESEFTQSAGITNTATIYANTQTIGRNTILNSIDLSQFSITVDSKEVFNGNKSGLDVIKEDNYTIVGNPSISDDGMLLSASKNNFINTGFNISNLLNKSWKIEGRWEYNGVNQNYNILAALAGHYVFFGGIAYRTTDFRLVFLGKFGDNDSSTGAETGITVYLNKNPETIDYRLEFDITTGQYTLYYSLDGGAYLSETYIPNTANKQLYNISVDNNRFSTIGGTTSDNFELGNKIDLNAFKIYVDGNLVYQPCLKIPYNLSKTGSKIVPAYARDRVIDLYEQEGHAGYYTIDEENKNFTLPMGEIYGMVENGISKSVEISSELAEVKLNKDHSNDTVPYIIETWVEGTSGYILYSNGYCEQWGRGNGGVTETINLYKQYQNEDYSVLSNIILTNNNSCFTLPITDQTTSSFTVVNACIPADTTKPIKYYWSTKGYLG